MSDIVLALESGNLGAPTCFVGGGTIGAGIAAACLFAGLQVKMIERDAAAVLAAQNKIEEILAESLKLSPISDATHRDV